MNFNRILRQFNELDRLGGRMRLAAEGWDKDWKCLIATIMSAQSRDETTIPIAEKLFEKFDSLDKLSIASFDSVLRIFKGLNYNRTKAKNVILCAKVLFFEYGGKVPVDFDKLLELPGVGRKTANVFLSEFGMNGLAVDTHVFQIARKLEWSKGRNPEEVERDLKKLFPENYWNKVNPVLVRFGKKYTSRKFKEELLETIIKIR